MLSSIFIALLQASAGDPAVAAPSEPPAAEAPAPGANTAPRTERRRVCTGNEAATGGRLAVRRCRWEEVPIREAEGAEGDADAGEDAAAATNETSTEAVSSDPQAGGASAAAFPAPPSPQ